MEVSLDAQHDRFAFRNTLLFVCPLPCELHGSFNRLGTGVHGKNHIILEHLRDLFGELAEDTIVERPRREGELPCLGYQCINNFGVSVTLKRAISKVYRGAQ